MPQISDNPAPGAEGNSRKRYCLPEHLGLAESLPPVDLAGSLSLTANIDWTKLKERGAPASDNQSLPDFRLDGVKDRADRPPLKSRAASIEYDSDNRISKITYAGQNKTRSFERDSNGSLSRITTRDEKGTRTYLKEAGSWYCLVDGMKLPLPGAISLSALGDLSCQTEDKGHWRTEKADGSILEEKTNCCRCRIALSGNGQVERIVRQDGSSIECRLDKRGQIEIVESGAGAGNGRPVIWRRQAEIWVSDSQPPLQRINMELKENGNTTFTGLDGYKHIIRGNGKELLEGPGKARFTFDRQGRIDSIEYPDGKTSSAFSYQGETTKLKSVTTIDRQANKTRTYTRDSDTDNWTITNAKEKQTGRWKGEAILSDDGIYSVRKALEKKRGRQGDGQDSADSGKEEKSALAGSWQSLRLDGSRVNEKIASDGSRAALDRDGRPLSISRSDGSWVEARYSKGTLEQIVEKRLSDRGATTWTKQKDNTWLSDSSQYPEFRRNLSISKEGELQFSRADGAKQLQRLDGTVVLAKKDGSTVEIDQMGLVRKVSIGKGDFRTFDYEAGQLIRVTDVTRARGTSAWENRQAASEPRERIKISAEGDLTYTNADGSIVIERSNFARVRLSADGKVRDVTQANGSVRTFSYNTNKEVIAITDTRRTSKGERTDTWTRQTNPDGSLSQRFSSPGKDGKQKVREAVNIAENGDYEYRGENGKLHFAPADTFRHRTGSFDSGDIEEARSTFEDVARLHKVNMKRLTRYMDQLEKRCRQGAGEGMKVPGEEQIAKTYETMARLLEGSGQKNFFNEKQRVRVCEQAMQNIAFPKHIDQGQNPTCNITTGEIYTASRRPERYADLMRQIATSGKFEYKDGRGKTHSVRPPNRGLFPGNEEAGFNIERAHKDGTRSWASKIFQVTAINTVTPGYSGGDPSFGIDRILAGTKRVSGDKMPYVGHRGGASLQMVPESTLWKLKKEGNLPCGVVTMGFAHVQVIHDVRKRNGRTEVWLGNQWGQANDPGWISMSRLHQIQGGGGW